MKPFELGYPQTARRRQLVDAVLRGEKTATAGLAADDPLPEPGERFLLHDFDDEPVGVIEITHAETVPADRIDDDFARAEGEGYDTVDGWRRAHEEFFGRTLGSTPMNAIRFRLTDLIVAKRYRGPARSGNGGYTSGLVASLLGGSDVEVTLRVPPPLETPLRIDGASIYTGDTLVAEAAPATVDLDVPTPPEHVEAAAPDPEHPFPTCFVCGPGRTDGLGLTPRSYGPLVAVPWRPDAVTRERVWAALDCPGAFAVNPEFARGACVLGRLAVHIEELPQPDEELVVVGWDLGGAEGRRSYAGTALFRGNVPLAWGRATWFAVPSGA